MRVNNNERGVLTSMWWFQRVIGSLNNDDGDVNENGKKAIGLDLQNNNFIRALHHVSLYISFPSLNNYDGKIKCLISRFDEDGNTRKHFSFSFPELWYSSANSLFKRRFRSRGRHCCLSFLIWISRRPWYFCGKHISIVEIVTAMRINAFYLLDFHAWTPKIKYTPRFIR